MTNCPICNAEASIFADFGFGPHRVTEEQVQSFKGPIKSVTYSISHKSWCWSSDARIQRENTF